MTDACITRSANDFGSAAKVLRLQSGTFCVVSWQAAARGTTPTGTMLIGAVLANGDPWIRSFTRRICRWLTADALAHLTAAERIRPPDYAACVLVDRPDRTDAKEEMLKVHVYEVGRDASLADID